jgi:hypothetical protein
MKKILLPLACLMLFSNAEAALNGKLNTKGIIAPHELELDITFYKAENSSGARILNKQRVSIDKDGNYQIDDRVFKRLFNRDIHATINLMDLNGKIIGTGFQGVRFKRSEKKYLEYFKSLELFDVSPPQVSLAMPATVSAFQFGESLFNFYKLLASYHNKYVVNEPKLPIGDVSWDLTFKATQFVSTGSDEVQIQYDYDNLAGNKCPHSITGEHCLLSSRGRDNKQQSLVAKSGYKTYFVNSSSTPLKSNYTMVILEHRVRRSDGAVMKNKYLIGGGIEGKRSLNCKINYAPNLNKYVSYLDKYVELMQDSWGRSSGIINWQLDYAVISDGSNSPNREQNLEEMIRFAEQMGDSAKRVPVGIQVNFEKQKLVDCK